MTQLLLLKVALIADIAGIVIFVADYTRLAQWWTNPVGRTIVIKDLFLLVVVLLTAMSVFFRFSRLTSMVAAWIQIGALGAVAVVMLWRVVVFERLHRDRRDGDSHLRGVPDEARHLADLGMAGRIRRRIPRLRVLVQGQRCR